MSARRISDSFDFRLESLEGRALLSGAPIPDPSEATILTGQHPIATEAFLNGDDDWTVAQPGHGDGLEPTYDWSDYQDELDYAGDVYTGPEFDFDNEDLSWADNWNGVDWGAELDAAAEGQDFDLSGASGLPGIAAMGPALAAETPKAAGEVSIPEATVETGTSKPSASFGMVSTPEAPSFLTFGAASDLTSKKVTMHASFINADLPKSGDLIGL